MTRQKETVKWKTTRNKKREKKKHTTTSTLLHLCGGFNPVENYARQIWSFPQILGSSKMVLHFHRWPNTGRLFPSDLAAWSLRTPRSEAPHWCAPPEREMETMSRTEENLTRDGGASWTVCFPCFRFIFFLEMHNLMSWLFHWCLESTVYAGLYLVLTIWQLSMTCHVFAYVFLPVVIEFVAWLRCCGFH